MKIVIAQINIRVGDFQHNLAKITEYYKSALKENADLIVYPELTVSGYPILDLGLDKSFIEAAQTTINHIIHLTTLGKTNIIIGAPIHENGALYNSALFIGNGKIISTIHKRHLPNYGVFEEPRIFKKGQEIKPIEVSGIKIGIMVCEDLWFDDVSEMLSMMGCELFVVINSSPFDLKKHSQRNEVSRRTAINHRLPLIYINQLSAQDELIFDGGSFALNGEGEFILQPVYWQERGISIILQNKSITAVDNPNFFEFSDAEHIYQALMFSLIEYTYNNGFKKVAFGISGGIDSALIAILTADVFGIENTLPVFLPSEFTDKSSKEDVDSLIYNMNHPNTKTLCLECSIQNIKSSLESEFIALNMEYAKSQNLEHRHNFIDSKNITKENIQARVRGLLLMALVNEHSLLLLSTGNKSELAVGYTTLYGDMCGGFAPIKDLYKTQIYDLIKWRNNNIPVNPNNTYSIVAKINVIPENIIIKAPSAELSLNQKDQDSLPEYEILDKILFCLIESNFSVQETAKHLKVEQDLVLWINKMLSKSEFKRKQGCLGPKISTKMLSYERRYPITHSWIQNY